MKELSNESFDAFYDSVLGKKKPFKGNTVDPVLE